MGRSQVHGYANCRAWVPAVSGAPNETEALRMSLVTMVECYERALRSMPANSRGHQLVAGAFGKAPEVARMVLGVER